jgi:hypothetical protein
VWQLAAHTLQGLPSPLGLVGHGRLADPLGTHGAGLSWLDPLQQACWLGCAGGVVGVPSCNLALNLLGGGVWVYRSPGLCAPVPAPQALLYLQPRGAGRLFSRGLAAECVWGGPGGQG